MAPTLHCMYVNFPLHCACTFLPSGILFLSGCHQAPGVSFTSLLEIKFAVLHQQCPLTTTIPLPPSSAWNPPATGEKIEVVPDIGNYIQIIRFGGSRVSEESVGTDIVDFVCDASARFGLVVPKSRPLSAGCSPIHSCCCCDIVPVILYIYIIFFHLGPPLSAFPPAVQRWWVAGFSEESVCY